MVKYIHERPDDSNEIKRHSQKLRTEIIKSGEARGLVVNRDYELDEKRQAEIDETLKEVMQEMMVRS